MSEHDTMATLFLSEEEAARLLGVHRTTLRRSVDAAAAAASDLRHPASAAVPP